MKQIVMPRLDIDMETGTVVNWLKSENDPVNSGELLAKIMTLKVTVEVYSPTSGVLDRIVVPIRKEVPVGQVLCIIREANDTQELLEKAVTDASSKLGAKAIETRTEVSRPIKEAERKKERIIASPLAKKIAEEHSLDLGTIAGTGPEGRITREDVLRKVEENSQVSETVLLSGIRKIVADRMSESFRTTPHATVVIDVDASQIIKLRDQLKKGLRYHSTPSSSWQPPER